MTEQNAAPGWYPDGTGVERWWDGEEWTDDTHAIEPVKYAQRPPEYVPATTDAGPSHGQDESTVEGAVAAGWVFALLFSPLGFLIGLFLIGKSKDAGKIMALSVVVAVICYLIYSVSTASTDPTF